MSDVFWRIAYKGKPIRLSLNDLSLQRLREMKSRFGQPYGIPAEYIALLLRGDMDAVACALWINQQKAGGDVEDPTSMDFSLDDFEPLEDPPPEPEKKGKGKGGPPPTRTPDSAPTASTTSDTDTSFTSPTSAD
jgi:hypothetical protein